MPQPAIQTNRNSNLAQPTRSLRQTSSSLSSPLRSTSLTRAGNTLATATPLGAFPPGKRTVRDALEPGSFTDFFQFEVTANSRIRMLLANSARTKTQGSLLNASGAVIASATSRGGKQGEVLVPRARPGVYYLRVKNDFRGTRPYTLNLFVNRSGGPEPLPCGCGT